VKVLEFALIRKINTWVKDSPLTGTDDEFVAGEIAEICVSRPNQLQEGKKSFHPSSYAPKSVSLKNPNQARGQDARLL
jgi:hypothetical protein